MQKRKIDLSHIAHDLYIDIFAVIPDTLFLVADAQANNEAPYQIVEGCFYQYKLSNNDYYFNSSIVIEQSNFNRCEGRISPNIYVGTLALPIFKNQIEVGTFHLEVQSIKTSYRKDYRFMLESITKHATDLILQTNSPVNQSMEVDFDADSKTLYQQFCFVKSIIDTEEFDIAIQQIIKSPATKWQDKIEHKDVRGLKRLHNKDVRQLIHSQNRVGLPKSHHLRTLGISSIALKIPTSMVEESRDTPENRFIKHVLEVFLFFCEEIQLKSKIGSRLNKEAITVSNKLEIFLQHSLFKGISRPTTLKLNSPILQKKAGYREVLKTWLMFNLAAKLTWIGGEDVYSAGNKNIAKLYEYWLFFKLLDAIKETFTIDSDEYLKLIKYTNDTLGLQLKEGKQIALSGTHISKERELSVKFSYNKTFGSNHDLTQEGSWTLQMKPDYTLSIWPKELDEKVAERTEQIVHIHFDAKYKVKNKDDNSKFKEVDVHKMHAYKDAIRRTGGAYILYPGIDDKPTRFEGFHEILPGLGAFAIRPSEENSGIEHLINFITEVKNHFLNRASQRENVSTKRYQIIKDKPGDVLLEPIPEFVNEQKLIPDETFILIGYYKSKAHLEWILNNRYNFRTGIGKGSLPIGISELNATYILLHGPNETKTSKIYQLKNEGILIYSAQDLIDKKYPTIPKGEIYLMYRIELDASSHFDNSHFDLTKLKQFSNFRNSPKPITISLSELMKVKIIK